MIEEYITTLLPTINQEWARDYLENLINTNQESINEINQAIEQANHLTGASTLGEPLKEFAFGAQTYISDESDAVVFLKNLLNEFQGKAIIVDLWATWCAPCITDMKGSKVVKEELAEIPIEVVYICTENKSSEEKWTKRIAEIKSTGTHIYINNKLTNALMEKFELSGYPSYLFFDENGKYHQGVVQRISNLDVEKLKKSTGTY